MITNAITSAFRMRIKGNLHPEERTPTRGDNRWKSQRMEGYSLCSPFEAEMCVGAGSHRHLKSLKRLICTHNYFCFHFFVSLMLNLSVLECAHITICSICSSNRMNSTIVILPFNSADPQGFPCATFFSFVISDMLNETLLLLLLLFISNQFKHNYVVGQLSGSLACVMR